MRASLFEKLRTHHDIVMLGDSLTARGEWAEFFPGMSIVNRGIGGDTTSGILARLEPIIALRPKIVFIMAGINDLARQRDTTEILYTYEKIITELSKEGIKIVVQSTLYTAKHSQLLSTEKITEINQILKNRCAIKKECHFLDLNSSMSKNGLLLDSLTGDGIHLNGKGYMAWTLAISEIINPYKLATPKKTNNQTTTPTITQH